MSSTLFHSYCSFDRSEKFRTFIYFNSDALMSADNARNHLSLVILLSVVVSLGNYSMKSVSVTHIKILLAHI